MTGTNDGKTGGQGGLGLIFIVRHQARYFQLFHGGEVQAIQRTAVKLT
jgi:hypothetical protein